MPEARHPWRNVPCGRTRPRSRGPRRPASECRWPAVFRKSYHTRDSEARRRPRGGRPPNAGGPLSLAKRTIDAMRRPDGGPSEAGLRMPEALRQRTINAIRRRDGGPTEAGLRMPEARHPWQKRTIDAIRRPDRGRPPNSGGPPSLAKRIVNAIRRPDGGPTEAGLRIPEARHPRQNVP